MILDISHLSLLLTYKTIINFFQKYKFYQIYIKIQYSISNINC